MPVLTPPPAATAPPQARPVTDLLEAAGRGDQDAWTEVVRRYSNLVTAVVRSFRLQEADARDAEQRTWLRLMENHDRIRDPGRLGGWLATTGARECLRILRDARGLVAASDVDTVPDPRTDIEQQVIDADTAARLWGFVTLLPPRRRAVVRALFADEPAPYADIARATGIPIGSLGPTRARVLHQLRLMLDDPARPNGRSERLHHRRRPASR
ncbi:RNA polymerase sigma factor [Pseudonocardia bannensis]|uniref:Sigma-70 family RNA polymerase sigma factor n=1 Tax=Pseudonocardia bannensis TaxID=630973 RepID=A0A848DK74_9PSEU|nr:sigma-70 family RNA polymerase sigma factor [Pseudonocardia bannensis]NMH93092.1 sigma-70 family RNA polymerase sigma factor [Pseudonocardia bannensis]